MGGTAPTTPTETASCLPRWAGAQTQARSRRETALLTGRVAAAIPTWERGSSLRGGHGSGTSVRARFCHFCKQALPCALAHWGALCQPSPLHCARPGRGTQVRLGLCPTPARPWCTSSCPSPAKHLRQQVTRQHSRGGLGSRGRTEGPHTQGARKLQAPPAGPARALGSVVWEHEGTRPTPHHPGKPHRPNLGTIPRSDLTT